MRVLVVLAIGLLGCSDTSSSSVDARTDPAVCTANREAAIDRTCTVAADCALVRSADCCGTIMLAVKAGTEGAFPAVESTYEACLACPPLGCAHQDQAEDGAVPGSGQAIVPACVDFRCTSVVQ